ncbi:glucose-6-phosphate dehydrogenase [bacterium]|jgi:glucose-6-phosphate 1-dehydrogenase|nr:glucose-6-phosphate dehydrogenase [bacterium]MBT3581115.1 glucose-6-phosphate dehydrogenase [bacterium]MBT4552576.1 glucose-6-phosphate dehydrogenase [bacterium]MBT5988239.1 glucose-6-phosphate dehydrogenase [bacterium]MBT7087916.1 glucose-6-phosphate dehydrogenase [bacterium]
MKLVLDNFTLVIFGASGDLAKKKLLPALYELVKIHDIKDNFRIIGFGRSVYNHETFRNYLGETFAQAKSGVACTDPQFKGFCEKIFYVQGDYEEASAYQRLKEEITLKAQNKQVCSNVLFYLATPPQVSALIIKNLNKTPGLNGKTGQCWNKVIVEKPFGTDLKSARALNHLLAQGFLEKQIYRIDHYLAKETVQNIFAFRFANTFFEQIWNSQCIDNVQIMIAEDFGIFERGRYYEKAGLIRDIIQNHGLQLLATIAMDAPKSDREDAIRDQKLKIFKAIHRMKEKELRNSVVLGQYEGYTQEKNVASDSQVETYAAIKFLINNQRWSNVPFYICAGKNLKKNLTEIVLNFRKPKYEYFKEKNCNFEANQLVIQIQPEEKINLKFGAKRPGEKMIIEPVKMAFDYKTSFTQKGLSAYHRLLEDAILGDQTRYVRKDCVEELWKIVDNIKTGLKNEKPIPYKPKTWGPKVLDF